MLHYGAWVPPSVPLQQHVGTSHTMQASISGTARIAGWPHRTAAKRKCVAMHVVTGKAPVVDHLKFPQELALFPVQPVGIFIPGMTKTLHLYEPHFIQLLEEALAHPQQLMCTAVMEPFLGKPEQTASMGSFVGGSNSVFSCACLIKVLDAKPYVGGYLVRIRGEARLGICNITQVEPYHRAQVFSLPDPAPVPHEVEGLQQAVDRLDDVMRGVQLLASKFRCTETAAIQQAFRYVNEQPLVPNIQEPLPPLDPRYADGMLIPPLDINTLPVDKQPSLGQRSVEAAAGDKLAANSTTQDAIAHALQGQQQGDDSSDGCRDSQEDFDLQRACRLSYASLQWLPESTVEERYEVLRGRLLAMEAISLAERVKLVTEIMDAARASLSARVSLKAMS